eukprot:2664309-Rhodomonas_salina.1
MQPCLRNKRRVEVKLLSKTPQRNQCIATHKVRSREAENSKQTESESKPAAKMWVNVLHWKS